MATYTNDIIGKNTAKKEFREYLPGHCRVNNEFTEDLLGKNRVNMDRFTEDLLGHFGIEQIYSENLTGRFHVLGTALFELYRGVDSEPDLSSAPWETFTSSPHETAALAAGHTYYFVLRYRDAHGIVTGAQESWKHEITAGGDEVNRPSEPVDVVLEPAASGAVRVRANYNSNQDSSTCQAEKWAIFITDNGSNPDPDNDTPTEITFSNEDQIGGVVFLDWTSSAYGNGATIKVIARVRRSDSGSDVDSDNTVISTTTASTAGPSQPGAGSVLIGQNRTEQQ